MRFRFLLSAFVVFSVLTLFGRAALPIKDDFVADQGHWAVEQMPGGTVKIGGGMLEIEDAGGCTVWLKEKLTGPVTITYDATVVRAGGPHDRISDLNCFWMASDPRMPDLFAPEHRRTGKFEDYDALQTYYVGQGGNGNTTTRFRRYEGGGVKPLLPQYDKKDKASLLEGNRTYKIKIEARADGVVRYYRDGELVFEFKDPKPLREGWFGFRTVMSHLRIQSFRVEQGT